MNHGMSRRDWTIYKTEQALLPDEDRDCLVCRGHKETEPLRVPNQFGMYTKKCFLCGGTGVFLDGVKRLAARHWTRETQDFWLRTLKTGYCITNSDSTRSAWWQTCGNCALVGGPPTYRYVIAFNGGMSLDLKCSEEELVDEGIKEVNKLIEQVGKPLQIKSSSSFSFTLKDVRYANNVGHELVTIAEKFARRVLSWELQRQALHQAQRR